VFLVAPAPGSVAIAAGAAATGRASLATATATGRSPFATAAGGSPLATAARRSPRAAAPARCAGGRRLAFAEEVLFGELGRALGAGAAIALAGSASAPSTRTTAATPVTAASVTVAATATATAATPAASRTAAPGNARVGGLGRAFLWSIGAAFDPHDGFAGASPEQATTALTLVEHGYLDFIDGGVDLGECGFKRVVDGFSACFGVFHEQMTSIRGRAWSAFGSHPPKIRLQPPRQGRAAWAAPPWAAR